MKMSTKDKVIINVRKPNAFLEDMLDIAKIAVSIIIAFIGISIIGIIGFLIYKYIS
ncbi:hypothetical protein [Carnobacterium jeotgali]|uniref:hypothetical protein n=1 Tax=Carnobacterium jeotgali TaxID=545534 RepID=UPI000A94365E|nr:hypothetical protein [Carnobacterium jeotgali]